MDPANGNMLYHSDFLETSSLSPEPGGRTLAWWLLAIVEVFLITGFVLQYFGLHIAGTPTNVLHAISRSLEYPFTATLTTTSADSWWVTLVAMVGYFVLTYTFVRFLEATHSPRSRIERARTLSRKKYSHY